MERRAYPSDVSDEEWAFVAPYLTLMKEEAPQRRYSLREVFNGLRWIIRAGAPWRFMPSDLPAWEMVYQQSQRWIKAGVFEHMVHDLRALLRLAEGRHEQPTAAIFDSRTLQSSPESGHRAGYDGAKRKKEVKPISPWTASIILVPSGNFLNSLGFFEQARTPVPILYLWTFTTYFQSLMMDM